MWRAELTREISRNSSLQHAPILITHDVRGHARSDMAQRNMFFWARDIAYQPHLVQERRIAYYILRFGKQCKGIRWIDAVNSICSCQTLTKPKGEIAYIALSLICLMNGTFMVHCNIFACMDFPFLCRPDLTLFFLLLCFSNFDLTLSSPLQRAPVPSSFSNYACSVSICVNGLPLNNSTMQYAHGNRPTGVSKLGRSTVVGYWIKHCSLK